MEAPQTYKNAGIANLISGGLTVIASALGLLSSFCMAFWLLFTVLMGAFTAYIGWQMYQGQVSPQAKVGTIVGLVAGVLSCNIFSLAASGFAFMQLSDDEVVGWLEQNGVS